MNSFRVYLDIFYLFTKGQYIDPNGITKIRGFRGNLRFFYDFALALVKDICLPKRRVKPFEHIEIQDKKWLFYMSVNNFLTLEFLKKHFDDLAVVHHNGHELYRDEALNLAKIVPYTVQFTKYTFVVYLYFKKKYTAVHYKKIIAFFHLYAGYVKVLEIYRPQCIFISNDHTPKSRALILAAKNCGTKIFYFQHASVSPLFPPLRFTASILFGEFSKNIYTNIKGSEGDIHLAGNHRYNDVQTRINKNDQIRNVGLAYNIEDDLNVISHLCRLLIDNLGNGVLIIRRHPRDSRNLELPDSGKLRISNPLTENSLEFLSRIDCLIAGNSSILLEAALLNVKPIYTQMSKKAKYDYYEFVKMKVAIEASTEEFLLEEISNRVATLDYRQGASYYDASIGSPFEFRIKDEIIRILRIYGIE